MVLAPIGVNLPDRREDHRSDIKLCERTLRWVLALCAGDAVQCETARHRVAAAKRAIETYTS